MPLFGPEEGGRQAKIGWSRPKTAIFWPFLAFRRHLGGLKDPLEVRVEVGTCKTIHGTYFEGILSQKSWTGLAGGSETVTFWPKYGLPRPLNHVFCKTGASGSPLFD